MKIRYIGKGFLFFIFIIYFFEGISSAWFWENDYLAKVNQEVIDIEDFQKRLSELHRQRSMQRDKGRPSKIDLWAALTEMIDDFLLYQEGRQLGLDKDPEFLRRASSYLEFQSILRLRKEEIKDKIQVDEDEIRDYYEELNMKSKSGEKTAPEYERVKGKIRKKIYKKKERVREREYIDQLKKNAKIEIDSDVLSSIGDNKKKGNEKVASINGNPIFVSDLKKEYGKALMGKKEEEAKKIRKRALEGLIEYLLIKGNALAQNYSQKDPSFGKLIEQYRIRLMSVLFKRKIISPQVKITEEDLKEYYKKNRERYRAPSRYKLLIIKVKSEKDAANLYEELKAGADFSRLARSKENMIESKNNPSWWNSRDLTLGIRQAVEKMKVGEISNIIKNPKSCQIVKLLDLEKGVIIDFRKLKKMIRTHLGREMYQSLLKDYLKKLKERSTIKIDEDVLKKFEKKLDMKVKNAS